jgi:CYTH domain-containing protein
LEQLTPTERVGAKWFQKQLADQRDEGYATALRFIERDFPKLDRRVRQRLESAALDPRVAGDRPVNFAVALEELIADHSATLTQQLEAVHGPEDEDAAHSARISAKRLRYLMELIERDVKAAKSGVGHLKALQDILGELHDAQVVSVDFTEACEQAAAAHARRLSTLGSGDERNERERRRIRRRNATPGMLALVRLCRDAHDERFHEFLDWREGTWPKLLQETERVLEALREHAPPDLEVERKYLLTKLPDAARTADAVEVDQGWLPGERLVERIRRMKTKDGERFYRTVKAGSGVTRIEIEEEASVEVFEQLWPLTNGRRVRKRRYYVPDGELTWEIDEFLDRELWLAEVELASPTIDVTIPTWLADSVEREVTGEPEYVNVNLAQ